MPMIVDGVTERECSKQERMKRTQAAVKSRAAAEIDAFVATSRLVARAKSTVNWIAANAESKTLQMSVGYE